MPISNPNTFINFANGTFETAWPSGSGPSFGYSAYGTGTFQRSSEQANQGTYSGKWAGVEAYPRSVPSGQTLHNLVLYTGSPRQAGLRYALSMYFRYVPGGNYTPGDQIFIDVSFQDKTVAYNVADGIGQWRRIDIEGTLESYSLYHPIAIRPRIVSAVNKPPSSDPFIGGSWYFDAATVVEYEDTPPPVLTVALDKTDVTTFGGADGTITTTVKSGIGPYTYAWLDGPITKDRTDLVSGTYTVTVTDTGTGYKASASVTVNQPDEEQTGTYFDVPMMNSLRFVVNPVAADLVNNFQTWKNTLFKDMYFPGYKKRGYCQKLMLADVPLLQFHSDYLEHTVKLYTCADELVRTFEATMVEKNVNVAQSFAISIRNNPGFPGTSRVYFMVGPIPVPVNVGNNIEIENNPDGFDGTYAVSDIRMDTTLNYQYLVIPLEYDAPTPQSTGNGLFVYSRINYNVFEAPLSMAGLDEGTYYVRIEASNGFAPGGAFAVSEPIDLRQIHINTNLVEYRNIDNAFGMTWSTGYIGMVRVPSVFFEESAGGTRSVNRNSDYSLKKVNAKKTHVMVFETYMLPPWLHLKLGVIFDCDVLAINKLPIQTDQDYEEAKYPERYKLGNSSIEVEELHFFDKYNSTGISSVNGGFLLSEDGFIKR